MQQFLTQPGNNQQGRLEENMDAEVFISTTQLTFTTVFFAVILGSIGLIFSGWMW